jgi:hypothetical protein
MFENRIDMSKFQHNKHLTNSTQSQQYIMDIIDQKFEKLKDSIYKLGISPIQFRNMVEGQALFEWSSEVAVALGVRFCSWVVAEEVDNEDMVTVNDGGDNEGYRSESILKTDFSQYEKELN